MTTGAHRFLVAIDNCFIAVVYLVCFPTTPTTPTAPTAPTTTISKMRKIKIKISYWFVCDWWQEAMVSIYLCIFIFSTLKTFIHFNLYIYIRNQFIKNCIIIHWFTLYTDFVFITLITLDEMKDDEPSI